MPKNIFRQNKEKDGWKLISTIPATKNLKDLEAISFLKGKEQFIKGEEIVKRAKELKANLGQLDAEYLLEHQELISTDLQKYCLMFPGTVWQDPYGSRCIPCLYWDGDQWYLNFYWLDNDWYDYLRVLQARKSTLSSKSLPSLDSKTLENRVKNLEAKINKVSGLLEKALDVLRGE